MRAEPGFKSRSGQQEWLSWSSVPRAASPRLGWGSLTPSSWLLVGAVVRTEGQSRSEGTRRVQAQESHGAGFKSPRHTSAAHLLCAGATGGPRGPHSLTVRGQESQSSKRGGGETVFVRVIMEGLLRWWHFESWTIKKAEHQRIDTFELWCWRRLFRVPWTARRSNQSILKEISPGCSLEGLMLKLQLQFCGLLMRRADSFEKTLILGKTEGRRRRGMTEDERAGWHDQLNCHEFEQTPGVGDGQGGLACCSPWGHDLTNEEQQPRIKKGPDLNI